MYIYRKYLRDAEKRFYALLSHQYTLDIVELQISDMKTETDSDSRLQFLQTVYKIWEHGVHKLAKEQERTNILLAEAYSESLVIPILRREQTFITSTICF